MCSEGTSEEPPQPALLELTSKHHLYSLSYLCNERTCLFYYFNSLKSHSNGAGLPREREGIGWYESAPNGRLRGEYLELFNDRQMELISRSVDEYRFSSVNNMDNYLRSTERDVRDSMWGKTTRGQAKNGF